MDKKELIELFNELDKELKSGVDIILIGGAAMLLHYGAMRTTRDIDVLFLRGDISSIRAAIKSVAENRHLEDDWMNDAAKGYANIFPSDFYHRLIPLEYNFQNIRIYINGGTGMENRLDILFKEWHLLGGNVLLREIMNLPTPRSPEEVIAESTSYCRDSGRLT